MLPYWLMFSFWSLSAVQAERRRAHDPRLPLFIGAAIVMTIMIGLRTDVGADWRNYIEIYDTISLLAFPDALTAIDPGYGLLNWLGAKLDWGVTLANVVCGALFFAGVARLAWRQPNPALAVLVAVPYLVIVVAMGYTRQAAAIGLVCFAVADASEKKLIRIVVLVALAALFHKTALLMLPIILAPVFLRNSLFGILGTIAFVVLFAVILRNSADSMIDRYVAGDYDSQGAAIRVSMNVLAAITFLIFRKTVDLPYFQKVYWTLNAILALLSIVALAAVSASSGIDRLSLYFIPLQMVIYSRLPYIVSKTNKAMPSVLFGVIFYSFCIQFVWLNYADNAQSWLPYRSVLWSSG